MQGLCNGAEFNWQRGKGNEMGLFGGTKSTIPATGYYALPGDLKSQYTNFYNAIPGATAAQNFVLPDFNQDQQSAFGMVRDQANPTAQGIQQMLAAYMNPYQDSVINEINRQGQGANSVLQQNINSAGQLGSNRQFLGANDVDLSRMNQIGGFLTNQFDKSLQTGLNQQQLGISNLLGIGNQQQQQQYQNQLAPLQGLQAQQGLLQPTVDYVGKSSPQTTVKTGGGLGGILGAVGNIASIASGLGGGGFFGAGGAGLFGGSGINGLGQGFSSLFSPSPYGPY